MNQQEAYDAIDATLHQLVQDCCDASDNSSPHDLALVNARMHAQRQLRRVLDEHRRAAVRKAIIAHNTILARNPNDVPYGP